MHLSEQQALSEQCTEYLRYLDQHTYQAQVVDRKRATAGPPILVQYTLDMYGLIYRKETSIAECIWLHIPHILSTSLFIRCFL